MSNDPYYTQRPEHFGEQLPANFFGPDNPVIDGQRWARYPRGFAWNGPEAQNNLFDGAPPINPFTGRPWKGAIIDVPTAGVAPQVAGGGVGPFYGALIQVDVGDAGGGRAFREFIVGPGTPVALALGQYQSVKVFVRSKGAAAGVRMQYPVRIQWIDHLPALSNTGLLRARVIQQVQVGVITPVPDGAVEMVFDSAAAAATVSWRDWTNGGAATDFPMRNVPRGTVVRTLGPAFQVDQICDVQFFLAGL